MTLKNNEVAIAWNPNTGINSALHAFGHYGWWLGRNGMEPRVAYTGYTVAYNFVSEADAMMFYMFASQPLSKDR